MLLVAAVELWPEELEARRVQLEQVQGEIISLQQLLGLQI